MENNTATSFCPANVRTNINAFLQARKADLAVKGEKAAAKAGEAVVNAYDILKTGFLFYDATLEMMRHGLQMGVIVLDQSDQVKELASDVVTEAFYFGENVLTAVGSYVTALPDSVMTELNGKFAKLKECAERAAELEKKLGKPTKASPQAKVYAPAFN